MSLRDKMNNNPSVVIGIASGLILIALVYLFYSLFGNSTPHLTIPQAYYSDDDGATYFTANADQPTPFDHNGKQAVRAMVFSCDNGTTRFIGYLQRDTEAGRKAMDINGPGEASGAVKGPLMEDKAIKGTAWIADDNVKLATPIKNVKCPSGSGTPVRVDPE